MDKTKGVLHQITLTPLEAIVLRRRGAGKLSQGVELIVSDWYNGIPSSSPGILNGDTEGKKQRRITISPRTVDRLTCRGTGRISLDIRNMLREWDSGKITALRPTPPAVTARDPRINTEELYRQIDTLKQANAYLMMLLGGK